MVKVLENYNVSHKYGFLLWIPERVGSRTIASILTHYDFKNNGVQLYDGLNHTYTHQNYIPKQYDDYKIICGARNPYSRVLSIFKSLHGAWENKNKETFKSFVKNHFESAQTRNIIKNPNFPKKPDYIIRIENLKEDFLKLPFINDVLNEKKLDYMTSHGKDMDNWTDYYDQEMKDIVFEYTKDHFLFWGYEK